MERKRLTDILQGGGNDFINNWNTTAAAGEFGPLPPNEYIARVLSGELFTSRSNGTPGYKLAFEVIEGEHAGWRFWHDVWLTSAALPMAKRDLGKLGISGLSQLEQPLPPGIRCKVKLRLRTANDGTQHNHVVRFDVIGIDPPEVDPYAPPPSQPGPPSGDLAGGECGDNSFEPKQFGAAAKEAT